MLFRCSASDQNINLKAMQAWCLSIHVCLRQFKVFITVLGHAIAVYTGWGMAIEDIVIREGPTKCFQKHKRFHEILCARRVIRTTIHTEDSHILDTTKQNSVAGSLGFRDFCTPNYTLYFKKFEYRNINDPCLFSVFPVIHLRWLHTITRIQDIGFL